MLARATEWRSGHGSTALLGSDFYIKSIKEQFREMGVDDGPEDIAEHMVYLLGSEEDGQRPFIWKTCGEGSDKKAVSTGPLMTVDAAYLL